MKACSIILFNNSLFAKNFFKVISHTFLSDVLHNFQGEALLRFSVISQINLIMSLLKRCLTFPCPCFWQEITTLVQSNFQLIKIFFVTCFEIVVIFFGYLKLSNCFALYCQKDFIYKSGKLGFRHQMDYKCTDSNSKESILLSPIRRQIIVIWCNADIETHRTESVGLELWRGSCNSLYPSQPHHSCLQPGGTKFSHHLAVICPLSGLQRVFALIQINFKILTWILNGKVKFVREVLTQFSLPDKWQVPPDYDISFEAGLSIFLHIGGNLGPLF